jgi:2-dehydro-3-deoxygluconokinase
MGKVLCFGEILLRYSMGENFPKQQDLKSYIGGAESNVALALAKWNTPVAYCTAMPDHMLSDKILAYYSEMGVDISKVIKSGERIGSYYLSQGADMKNTAVIYDRKFSSFSELKPLTLNWESIFEGVTWFHLTALSPALNSNIALLCEEALQIATKKGIPISLDLNYREKLWNYGVEPIDVIPKLAIYAHVIMGNIWAAERMLGITLNPNLVASISDSDLVKQAKKTSESILENYPNCNTVANTFRFNEKDGVKYFATLYHQQNIYKSETFFAAKTIDKVGTGDCFMAGLIYGILNKKEPKETVEFAASAAYQKFFIKGDATSSNVKEIEELMPKNV